jgi:outer membrane receptor protein involved in Fe transport
MVMAGTLEQRVGGRLIWLADGLLSGNRLAVGVESKQFRLGLRDADGANFISNLLSDRGNVTNQRNTYVYRTDMESGGLFVEDSQDVGEMVTLFVGLRFDVHSFWGTALSPRAGVLVTPDKGLVLRLSYQSGFRGAPGVHYTGGWRRDGLLHESNFDEIDRNPAVSAMIDNFPSTEPERIHSFELGADYAAHPRVSLAGVAYVGWVENVIDVFAIDLGSVDNVPVEQQSIGTDPIGDWGGWFLFKNNAGRIVSSGGELALTGRLPHVDAILSYSAAFVLDAPDAQIGTMYVSGSPDDLHFKAYPEHVLRLHLVTRPCVGCSVGMNGLFFSRWYPPSYTPGTDELGDAGLVINASAAYRLSRFELALTVKNLLDANPLWPMNSNIGAGLEVSQGTPALEDVTGWLTLRADL